MEMTCEVYDKVILLEGIGELVPELQRTHEELQDNVVRFDVDQRKNA